MLQAGTSMRHPTQHAAMRFDMSTLDDHALKQPHSERIGFLCREVLLIFSSSSKLAEDIRYGLAHWDGLTRFLDDGRFELDTNPVENAIRPICLTRKNALFAGHEIGAENWALLSSIVATCRLNDVNPVAYLAETLSAIINGLPQSQIEDLMPWRFRKVSSPSP
jgi:transposase